MAYVRDFGAKIPGARPSMLLDHLAGPALGDRRDQRRDPAGSPWRSAWKRPTTTLVSALVRAKETAFDAPPRQE